MMFFTRRSLGVAGALIFAAVLVACGDPEPGQRKAFMAFLQGMIDRPGVHVMNLKADDDKTFGDYTKHYAVILDFNNELRTVAEQFANRLKQIDADQAAPRSIEQMVTHRSDLIVIREETGKMGAAIRERLAAAETRRAVLKQPDNLKKVYDAAFNKLVTAPARVAATANAVLADGTRVSLQLVDYIVAHPRLTVSGSQIRANDNKTLSEISDLLKAHDLAGVKLNEAKQNMRSVMEGN